MKKFIVYSFIFIAFIAFFSLYAEEKKTNDEKILAEVNGIKISENDFEKEVQTLPENYRSMINANKNKFLDDLILQEVLYQEAKKQKLEDDKEFQETLEKLKKKILVQRLLEKEIMDKGEVSDDDLKKYYEANKDLYKEPEQINAAHILVKLDEQATEALDKAAREKIEGLLKKANSGDDFSQLAMENSDCPSKSKGGDLGYFSRGQMVPEFEETAFKLNKGEISEVVKTKFGYHIIKLLDKKEAKQSAFNEVKEEIKQKLAKDKQKSIFESYTKDLKAKAKITINKELLK